MKRFLGIILLAATLTINASAQPKKHKVRHIIARTLVISLEVVTAPVVYPLMFLIDIGAAS